MWKFWKRGKGRVPGEHSVSGAPPGTEIIHNPTRDESDALVGFPEGSQLLERHGKHFHLLEGHQRMALEVTHFVERQVHGRPDLVKDETLYILPAETSLREARRIGYDLLDRQHPRAD